MSVEFAVRVPRRMPRSLLDPGFPLAWHPDEPPDPIPRGTWHAFLPDVSTRVTEVTRERRRVTVRVLMGAAPEDWNLALAIVGAAAGADGLVETDDGMVSRARLDQIYDADARLARVEDDAATVVRLLREDKLLGLEGPTRIVQLGPRALAELEAGEWAGLGARFLALIRRVLWIDPRYHRAAVIEASGKGVEFTAAVLSAESPCVLPLVDRIIVQTPEAPLLIPADALSALPLEATWLDDGNRLVEGVPAERWPDVCRAAEPHAL
ncbi:MAG TPA: hypothetical protein VGF23_07430 [Gaiellaceae bacterium]